MYLAQTAIAREVDSAFAWIGGICLVLLVGITVAMLYLVVRYRRRANPNPTPIHGNLALEVTWIIVPTVLVLFMFFKGYKGFAMMRDVPEDAMVVKVTAQQWFWTFTYPEQDVSVDRLFVPVNTPVKLEMTAPPDDVVHSLYIPAFRVKEDCVPGRETYLWFNAEKEGTYNIFCAEYCGKDHSAMLSELTVLSPEDYGAWLEKEVARKNKPVEMDPTSEEIIACDAPSLYKTYCASCHGPSGRGGLVDDARDFTSLAEWKQGTKKTDIFRTISEGVDGTQMRAFINISPWDRFALAHHVAAFNQSGGRPESTPEDAQQLMEEYRLGGKEEPRQTISIDEAMRAISREAIATRGNEDRDEE